MWKYVLESTQGWRHKENDQRCQDSCRSAILKHGDESILILACSDGAGSASHAERGAQLACDGIIRAVAEEFTANRCLLDIERDVALGWCNAIRDSLTSEASALAVPVRELACTLLFAVLGETASICFQIGDGAIVANREGKYEAVFWPQSGEYINTTNFLTDATFEKNALFSLIRDPINEAAIFSDGLERLALNYANKAAHGPFFEPMFRALRSVVEPESLAVPLRQFLDSPQVMERTDDDKTLILATRMIPSDAPETAL